MSQHRKHHRDLAEWLRRRGATNVVVDVTSRKKVRLTFDYRGRKLTTTLARTPSDDRALQNMTARLRQLMEGRSPIPTPGAPVIFIEVSS